MPPRLLVVLRRPTRVLRFFPRIPGWLKGKKKKKKNDVVKEEGLGSFRTTLTRIKPGVSWTYLAIPCEGKRTTAKADRDRRVLNSIQSEGVSRVSRRRDTRLVHLVGRLLILLLTSLSLSFRFFVFFTGRNTSESDKLPIHLVVCKKERRSLIFNSDVCILRTLAVPT